MDNAPKHISSAKSNDLKENVSGYDSRHTDALNDALPVRHPADIPSLMTDKRLASGRCGFTGTVEHFQLNDIIQMFCRTGKSVAISVTQGNRHGVMYIKNGEIVHAKYGASVGREAFFTILNWPDGIFVTFTPPSIIKPTITDPFEFLLLEAARRKDESGSLQTKTDVKVDEEPDLVIPEPREPATEIHDVSSIEDIKVDLLFKLGRMKIDFQTLKSVTPGTVFGELSTENAVDIIANGEKIGSGELVAHENRVGIRLGEY